MKCSLFFFFSKFPSTFQNVSQNFKITINISKKLPTLKKTLKCSVNMSKCPSSFHFFRHFSSKRNENFFTILITKFEVPGK